MTTIVGLDVGGAHLKVAVLENERFTSAHQHLCPLWKGANQLDQALLLIKDQTKKADHIAITMTGELSDLFDTRQQGVITLVDRLNKEFGDKALYWIAHHGFGTDQDAKKNHAAVGSTNFLATALAVAKHAPNAVLIDMGSTTTDIIPIENGKPVPRGLSDSERQQTGELVYTGLTRTAVMAVTNRVPFKGHWQTLAREYLATMADIYRLLGELPQGVALHDTADGRGKSQGESLARLARMMGRETAELLSNPQDSPSSVPTWKATAQFIAHEQQNSIEEGLFQVLSANPQLEKSMIITAGIGGPIVSNIAKRLSFECKTFGALIAPNPDIQQALTCNAPAAAVALLFKP